MDTSALSTELRATFLLHKNTLEWRKGQLQALQKVLTENETSVRL
jgi:hypothetical protein